MIFEELNFQVPADGIALLAFAISSLSEVPSRDLGLDSDKYNYDSDTLDRVKYGLEVIYINVTKISVILLTSLLFNVFKETLL